MQRQDGRDGSSEIGGGAEGDRTPDLRIANATLSQLSYGPMAFVAPLRGAADYGDRATACQAGLPAEPGLGILDAGPCMADGLASNLAALRGWRHAAICIRSSNALRECRARSQQYVVDVEAGALVRRGTISLPANVHYAWPHASHGFLYVASS